jgi:hypothetical protein
MAQFILLPTSIDFELLQPVIISFICILMSFYIGIPIEITGPYADLSIATSAPHTAATGWTRQVMGITLGTHYLLMISDSNQATGWFRSSSFKSLGFI